MPISLDYDRKENIIYTKAEGVIKIDDIALYFSSVATLDLKKGEQHRRIIKLQVEKADKYSAFNDLIINFGELYD